MTTINGYHPSVAQKSKSFEDLTPIFPNERIRLERPGCSVAMRIVDLVSPIGKGQRGMIVSQPKACLLYTSLRTDGFLISGIFRGVGYD